MATSLRYPSSDNQAGIITVTDRVRPTLAIRWKPTNGKFTAIPSFSSRYLAGTPARHQPIINSREQPSLIMACS